jgi:protein TonB
VASWSDRNPQAYFRIGKDFPSKNQQKTHIQIFLLLTAQIIRLLNMGALTQPEYESQDSEGPPEQGAVGLDKTQTGGVKHNGWVCLEPGSSPPEHQAGRSGMREPATTMANDQLIEPEIVPQAGNAAVNGHELDALLGRAFEEKPIWTGLYESIRDVFFPIKLPPLELTSTPIPVPDRMKVKANPWAIGISSGVNIAILLVILFFVGKKIIDSVKAPLKVTDVEVSDVKLPPSVEQAGGGGGGNQTPDMTQGKLPKIEQNPIVPAAEPLEKPKLAIESAINIQPDIKVDNDPTMPNVGFKSGVNVKPGFYGPGSGGGIGPGNGNGLGPGEGGGTGGGLYHVGGGVSAPVPIYTVDPEFSDEARRSKYQGVVLVGLIVNAQGYAENVHIVRALGMGLDEKAIEAVKKYKFRPAMKDGKTPVPVPITIEINFRLY